MRRLSLLLLALAVQAADEAPRHDRLGFPVRFNRDVITRNDVLRGIGAPASVLGAGEVTRDDRDGYLMERLLERVGEINRIEIPDEFLDEQIQRQKDELGGDAEFYRFLAQRGDTEESHRAKVRRQRLGLHLRYLLIRGIPGRHMPWSLQPTPREMRIAWEHDRSRGDAAQLRAQVHTLDLGLTPEERRALSREILTMDGEEAEIDAFEARRAEEMLAPRLARMREGLAAGKPFAGLAREFGGGSIEWKTLRRDPADEPETRFLQTAEAGTTSDPVRLPDGRYRFVHLLERVDEASRGPSDPDTIRTYRNRILLHRVAKAEALLKLRALDLSTLEPPMVEREFREVILSELGEAEKNLRELGLH